MEKLKYVKVEQDDGSYSSSIPLTVDSEHVDVDGNTLINILNSKANATDIETINTQMATITSSLNSKANASTVQNEIDTLTNDLNSKANISSITSLQNQINALTTQVNKQRTVLYGLKICYEGDSLTASRLNPSSTAYNGGAYPKLIADKVQGTYVNHAVGGGTLTSQIAIGGTRHSVYDNLANLPTNADIYVFSGGVNDYLQNYTLGSITSGYTDTLNVGTICGALEGILRYAIDHFLGKPILFVITHKVGNGLNPNTQGYTFHDVVEKIIQICNKYSIPYYNAYNESGVNGCIASQNNAFMTAGSTSEPDGAHINVQGYAKYYVPQIIQKLESMVNLDQVS